MYERKAHPPGIWIMYLRKSRQDDPSETVAEVLAKHEVQLQEHALRELGGRIPEENIYREIISGESIDEREEMQKVLARIEDPKVTGVLVIEPQRLSRGDLEDCGRLINSLRFTHTQVITPVMTYDLENKMERKFFQDELLRGRDYLEYTKEILTRGRIAAIKRGCYIGNIPPYGYDKIKIGKDNTLTPNENAEVVRTIFYLYTKEGLSPGRIAKRLNEMGIPAAKGGAWEKYVPRKILGNIHYAGKVVFYRSKLTPILEEGEITIKRLRQSQEDVIIADGKHPAIIDWETWELAQKRIANNPPVKHSTTLKNPFRGILYCSKCGTALCLHPYPHAETRMECRSVAPRCYKSVKYAEIYNAIVFALENSELPKLKLKIKNGEGEAAKIQQSLLAKFEKELQGYRVQEDKQFELLENGTYSQEVFERRHRIISEKIECCQKQINETRLNMPKDIDYAERVDTLENSIAILKDPNATPAQQNRILRSIVSRIEFTGEESMGRGNHVSPTSSFSLEVTLLI